MPVSEAIKWLKDAVDSGEDVGDELQAAVALMYGMLGRYDDMFQIVQQCTATNEKMKKYSCKPVRLAMLAYACRRVNTLPQRLQQLGHILDIELLSPKELVLNSLNQYPISDSSPNLSPNILRWIAFTKPDEEQNNEIAQLSSIQITLSSGPQGKVSRASWMHNTAVPALDWLPTSELVDQLNERFWFICEDK